MGGTRGRGPLAAGTRSDALGERLEPPLPGQQQPYRDVAGKSDSVALRTEAYRLFVARAIRPSTSQGVGSGCLPLHQDSFGSKIGTSHGMAERGATNEQVTCCICRQRIASGSVAALVDDSYTKRLSKMQTSEGKAALAAAEAKWDDMTPQEQSAAKNMRGGKGLPTQTLSTLVANDSMQISASQPFTYLNRLARNRLKSTHGARA